MKEENQLNKRQKKCIAALNHCKYLYQSDNSAAWYIFHPEHFKVRLNLTCRDVLKLVNLNIISGNNGYNKRTLIKK